jgi:hypothetical protein
MKNVFPILFLVCITSFSAAQEKMDYFLPTDVSYNQDIPAPDHYFEQSMGQWHLTHDQVLNYMKEIARVSHRAILEEYARSYENRPLVQLVFTSEENHQKLDELKELHLQYSEPGATISNEGVPLVVRLAYGVHGNESSATNSSVLTAYYLAAAQGEKIDSLLNQCIVLLDPCLNPDGYTRHTTWANSYQSHATNGDRNSRQFREQWPRGRSNHYWFDLNRDYLPLVNPESRGRIREFHEWQPNIVTDHHESSPDFSFFFQPGIPSRNNPLIPDQNYTLTSAIAAYHASFLDRIGSSYFSEEVFDDYYFGKGSTYPDVHGSIGILFEQSSIRGRIRETDNGPKSLSFGMRNQFTVTLSTLQAALDLRSELLEYQRDFYENAWEEAQGSEVKAYVFGSEKDRVKAAQFVDFLDHHNIQVYGIEQDIRAENRLYKSSSAYLVPVQQKQYRLIRTIFEEVSSFRDTSFYDISTWTIPHAFDVQTSILTSLKGVPISDQAVVKKPVAGSVMGGKGNTAYCFKWNEYSAPEALYELQKAGLRTKVATKEFSIAQDGSLEKFTYGTILIPMANQHLNEDQVFALATEVARRTGVDFYALQTGLTPEGIDMGSNSFISLEKPRILMFTGGSTSAGTAGEIWHLLDQRYKIPLTLIGTDRVSSINLDSYTTVILPGGSYEEWGEEELAELKRWIENGGVLIACGRSTGWLAKNDLGNTTFKDPLPSDSALYLSYAERRKESSIQGIGGAILNAKLDITHPLCYGYIDEDLAIFKRGTRVADPLGKKYQEPVRFASDPYLSGWISEKNLERLQEAPVLSIQKSGSGKLISFHETVNFRGFWMGTHKLFMNAIFFGDIIRL